MDTQRIKQLIERFYAGETSPEEYRELEEIFASDAELPQWLETERKVFNALKMSEPAIPVGLEERLEEAIDRAASRRKGIRPVHWLAVGSAAAAVVLCVSFALRMSDMNRVESDYIAQAVVDTVSPETTAPVARKGGARVISDPAEALRFADSALRDALAGIDQQKEVEKTLSEIKIDQKLNTLLK